MVREDHGDYSFSVSPRRQSAQAVAWEWRIYNRSSGVAAAMGYTLFGSGSEAGGAKMAHATFCKYQISG